MKKTLITLGLAGAAVLALSGASVFAMAQGFGTGAGSSSDNYAAMQAMHSSPAMQQAMSQYSPQLQAQCNSMNSQMSSHMNGASGSGMMSGW
jgi:hypothetical protein